MPPLTAVLSVFQRNYTVFVNKVPVADADLMATNGVVHAVSSIIRPLREYPPNSDEAVSSSSHSDITGQMCHSHSILMSTNTILQSDVFEL